MTSQFSEMMSSSNFFELFCFKLSYWSKFHVNIITGSGVMTISFYKGLTRNPEIGNTPVWVLPNIWRLGRVMDTKFGTNVSNKMLLNAAKCQGYSFYSFWVKRCKWCKYMRWFLDQLMLSIITHYNLDKWIFFLNPI